MRTRILFGSIMIVVISGVFVLDWWLGQQRPMADAPWWTLPGLPLAVLVGLLVVVGFFELARLTRSIHAPMLAPSGLLGTLALATLPVTRYPSADMLLAMLGIIVGVIFLDAMTRRRTDGALARLAATSLAVLYLGVGAALFLVIRLKWGVPTLVLFLVAVKFTDIGAYFVGSLAGRHKLIRWLSPGKSWEGLIGGVAIAVGVTLLLLLAMRQDPVLSRLSIPQAALLAAVLGVVGQFADLCESLLKRSAVVKDSGALVPSFGGVLDIVDSPLLAAPVAYLLLNAML